MPLAFVDIRGKEDKYAESTKNDNEVNYIVEELLPKLFENSVLPRSIGIITMYKAQRSAITAAIYNYYPTLLENDEIEICSVDGFQGREKDMIIISCVRSNPSNKIGFLYKANRLNVALTRAKYGLIIVGNRETLSGRNPMWRSLINYFQDCKAIASSSLFNRR